MLADKVWMKHGNFSVGANGCSNLTERKVCSVSMDAMMKVNDKLCVNGGWKGCGKKGWAMGTSYLSLCFCGVPNWKLAA